MDRGLAGERVDNEQHQQDINELMMRRREEHDLLRARGFNPYPFAFDRTTTSTEILASYKDDQSPWTVSVAGRIMSLRRMGKASFFHLEDSKGRIQVYLKQDDLGTSYDAFKLMDIGDLVGVAGFVFRTKTGEVSIHAKELTLLSKSLRPLPIAKEKVDEQGNRTVYDPLADKELRYRQRYVDLIVNRQRAGGLRPARADRLDHPAGRSMRRGIWKSRPPSSSRSTEARSPGRSSPITMLSTSISTCASPMSCT